eukprot:scaffold2510_cov169-Amphora_coffeaeformis.AAC.64
MDDENELRTRCQKEARRYIQQQERGNSPLPKEKQSMIRQLTSLSSLFGIVFLGWFYLPYCHAFLVPPKVSVAASSPVDARYEETKLQLVGDKTKRRPISTTVLHLKNPQQQQERRDDPVPKFQVPSPFTILIDGLAILLAVEFVGLLQEVNDVNFVKNGGWFQSLPTLEEQTYSISQVLQGWILNVALWSSTLTVVPNVVGEAWNNREANSWTTRFVPAFLTFAMLRILYPVGMAILFNAEVDWEPALLDTYVVGLSLGAARYLLRNKE